MKHLSLILKIKFLKSKFLLTILLLITTVSLFSFVDYNKTKNKKAKFFTCSTITNFGKVSRSGSYVSLAWTSPSSNAYFTYFGYSTITGTSFSGKTYSTQITVNDHNEGGTITITSHCTDGTTSGASHGTWTAN